MMFGFSTAQLIGFVLMTVAVILAPFFFYPIVVMQVMCYAVFAMGANLLMGSLGLLSLGQAAYFGIGGYVAGYLVQSMGLTPELGIIAAALVAGALGAVFGWLVIRRQAIYFAMITLALAQIVYFFAVEDTGFTGGENGIQGIPRGALFGVLPLRSDAAMYVLVAVIFLGCFLFVHRIMHSPFGQVVKAIRENEPRAISLGYKAEQYKWITFILAAAARRHRRRHQGNGDGHRDAVRCRLRRLGAGGADGAAGRHRHDFRAADRRAHRRRHAVLSGAVRGLGDRHPGRDFRRLRAGVPPRRDRRTGGTG